MGNMDLKYELNIEDGTIIHNIYTPKNSIINEIQDSEALKINSDMNCIVYNCTSRKYVNNNEIVIITIDDILINLLENKYETKKIEIKINTVEYDLISNVKIIENNESEKILLLENEEFSEFIIVCYKKKFFKKSNYSNLNMIYSKFNNNSLFIRKCIDEYSNMFGKISGNLTIIFSDSFIFDGLSWPGVILLKEKSENQLDVIAHEIAHQWFGQRCKGNQYWLRESIADFCSNIFRVKYCDLTLNEILQKARSNYSAWLINHIDIDLESLFTFETSFKFEAIVHGKCVLVLHMLYIENPKYLLKILNDWRSEGDFWAKCRRILNDKYENFFLQFVNKSELLPSYNIEFKKNVIIIQSNDKNLYKPIITIQDKNKNLIKRVRLTNNIFKLYRKNIDEYLIEGLIINNNIDFEIEGFIQLTKYLLGNKKNSLALRNLNKGLKKYKNNNKLIFFKKSLLKMKNKKEVVEEDIFI